MGKQKTLEILQKIQAGDLSPEDALLKLRTAPFEDLGYAKPDHHRELRQGAAEVIYGEGKTAQQIAGISGAMLDKGQKLVMVTRLTPDAAKETTQKLHDALSGKHSANIKYHELARILTIGEMPAPDGIGNIVVATGGTCDLPVAEEAAITAEALGNNVVRLYDVGVAGLHRLLSRLDVIMDAQAIVAVAGMEGALASVIGGLVDCPVIGVPVNVGYGACFNGLSALLTMLNSCSSTVCVVNINNGFGGGYMASLINHQRQKK